MKAEITSTRIKRADLLVVQQEFTTLRHGKGGLTARAVVAAARGKSSPLHKFFEWDDNIAGEKHRLAQAAELIRVVLVVIQRDPKDKPRKVRAWVSVTKAGRGRRYYPTVEALSDAEYRQQLLTDALRELDAFRRKYETLSELAAVFEALDEMSKKKVAGRK